VLQQASQNIDLLPRRSAIIPRPDGALAIVNDKMGLVGEFTPTDYAHGQLAGAMKFPRDFYHRLRAEHPEEWSRTLGALLHEAPQERRLLRTRGGAARAFLSSRYRRIDNDAVAAMVLPIAKERGLVVQSCEVTETKLYMQLISPKVEGEVRPGDVVQAGIILQNSEVGAASLSVKPLVYRLVCTNGMIAQTSSKAYRHLGGRLEVAAEGSLQILSDETRQAQDKATVLAVRDIIDHYTGAAGFAEVLGELREAADAPVMGDPEAAVEVLARTQGLLESESTLVLRSFLEDRDRTRWGLANAVTALANDHADYDRAVELEAMGGAVMALTGASWNAIATARA